MTHAPLPEPIWRVPASAVLQRLLNAAPEPSFTLGWLIGSLAGQSFGLELLILGIGAALPGISTFASLLIAISAFRMMLGRRAPYFPRWILNRPLPTRRLKAVGPPFIRALRFLEKGIRPRGRPPGVVMERLAGIVITLLNVRALVVWIPLTNIEPGLLIAFIALAYLEGDVLWLAISMGLGAASLAFDGFLAWEIVRVAAVR
ncbi:MAG TPA: exopolysaccharide biosynthesis protein [Alphaproteobacteria bacterium]|nr:exopolysaccharide biosynthesis protein [Alphaproteobacteria bacterium]